MLALPFLCNSRGEAAEGFGEGGEEDAHASDEEDADASDDRENTSDEGEEDAEEEDADDNKQDNESGSGFFEGEAF